MPKDPFPQLPDRRVRSERSYLSGLFTGAILVALALPVAWTSAKLIAPHARHWITKHAGWGEGNYGKKKLPPPVAPRSEKKDSVAAPAKKAVSPSKPTPSRKKALAIKHRAQPRTQAPRKAVKPRSSPIIIHFRPGLRPDSN